MRMSFRFPIAGVLSIICLAAPVWADYKAGVTAYQRADYATAVGEWQPLAQQGDVDAQYYLGLLYDFGHGVPQDFTMARHWYENAAVQGHTGAQANLGSLYEAGRGGPQDFNLAVTWYRRSAERGHEVAQRRLGLMYERGSGVPKDFAVAQTWYILATAHGDTISAELREALAKRMTSAQLFQAQQRAREWKPKVPSATTAHTRDPRKSKR